MNGYETLQEETMKEKEGERGNNPDQTQGKTNISESQWYTACWNYFSLLSDQRMKMLQYFISLEVFLAGAFITLISLESRILWAEIVVS